MFILLLGAPGSGKGTQGAMLAQRLGIPTIATGDIIRAAMKAGTPLGVQAKTFYDAGKLVPDTLILELIKSELAKPEAHGGASGAGGKDPHVPRPAARARPAARRPGRRAGQAPARPRAAGRPGRRYPRGDPHPAGHLPQGHRAAGGLLRA